MSLSVNFSERLKKARRLLGLTQQALADASGISRATLNRWESQGGNTASLEQIEILAKHLGVSAEDLVRSSQEGGPSEPALIPQIAAVLPSLDHAQLIEILATARGLARANRFFAEKGAEPRKKRQ